MINLFKREKDQWIFIYSPIMGKKMDITEVPDEVFSQKMVGDGVAIDPSEGRVTSPVEGEVIQIMDTKHAIVLKASNGIEMLIHIGIDTVKMKGEGFEVYTSPGDQVKVGDLLMTFELEKVREGAKSLVTPIVITNMEEITDLVKSMDEKDQWIMKAKIER
ncbi:PTS sugar transporter subunit IIA [Alkaliphilus serpentinus]|uniref:PTS glucose transporter subunit IIA n=1 Tax=Alkaliphilus serpentinus TaxID=1482731 RepID=A0A833HQC3_9FIRM|nr:PTS glucose transporter subunit IIA [Alkaliphilus serpentinus]KAB3531582.1 PTS glucose transporter subunit IIA [Alkaliphilus serpentinus]